MSEAPSQTLAVAIAGSPSPTSSSRRIALRVLGALAEHGWVTETVDLAQLPADPLLGRGEDARVRRAIELAGEARILVLATPIYRASYSGLLKCFFDLMPVEHLAGRVCALVATGTAPAHALAIDHGLRPLVASVGGVCGAHAVYATPADLTGGEPRPELVRRIRRVAEEADRLARALG